jgi:RNA polymerase sigma-54 factor
MKPSLQLKMGQHLTMTPQLQQAIRLLQLSALDLQVEIQEIIESNPMLEIDENEYQDPNQATQPEASVEESSVLTSEALAQDHIPSNSPLDSSGESNNSNQASEESDTASSSESNLSWDAAMSSPGRMRDSESEAEYYGSAKETLQDYLSWQMNLTPFTDRDRNIAMSIIDGIDDDGYLTLSLEEIAESLGLEIPAASEIQQDEEDSLLAVDEIEAVLHRIQNFDPVGSGSRDLRECLLVQLSKLPSETEAYEITKTLIDQYLTLLGKKDYRQILKLTGCVEDEIKTALKLIQTLNPKPGNSISTQTAEYVVPDVYVKKIKGRWRVDLNPEASPKLRVNQSYASMARSVTSSADSKYLKNNLQEARWFMKSLESRNDTLLKVSRRIVEEQQGFFDFGEEAMRPMVLSDIALAVDMHESTISRVTTQKYLHSPRGIFELKYFFSSHVNTSSGGECSSTAIRALLKKMIEAENQIKPLSDSKLATLLKDQGIMVARRTVAKYRESMNIPASNERKSLI